MSKNSHGTPRQRMEKKSRFGRRSSGLPTFSLSDAIDPNEGAVSCGKGHYSYDCLTIRGSDSKMECRGCHSIGHTERQCPTAHPELTGAGKGKGGKDKGGKNDDSNSWRSKGGWRKKRRSGMWRQRIGILF